MTALENDAEGRPVRGLRLWQKEWHAVTCQRSDHVDVQRQGGNRCRNGDTVLYVYGTIEEVWLATCEGFASSSSCWIVGSSSFSKRRFSVRQAVLHFLSNSSWWLETCSRDMTPLCCAVSLSFIACRECTFAAGCEESSHEGRWRGEKTMPIPHLSKGQIFDGLLVLHCHHVGRSFNNTSGSCNGSFRGMEYIMKTEL